MIRKLPLLALLVVVFATSSLFAQDPTDRYLNEIFEDVSVTTDIVYCENYQFLTGSPLLTAIALDFYEPTGDTEAERPLAILLHTGNFLPTPANGGCTGKRSDSTVVEQATILAKRGFVVAVADYRQGWNPVSGSQDVRTGTILQAAYRGVQDVKACVRFFRKDYATDNVYGIDTSRIMVGGVGTGGYVALGSAYLDKVEELSLNKFVYFEVTPPASYLAVNFNVNPPVVFDQGFGALGDFDGFGGDPAFNNPNHEGYPSNFHMVWNEGGAAGDSSWVDAGEMPFVGFHAPLDPFAPYAVGDVVVPTTGDVVIGSAAGSYAVAERCNHYGNNDVFVNAELDSPFSQAANEYNDGHEGLFPFVLPGVTPASLNVSSPWDWWAITQGEGAPCGPNENNPDMSPEMGRTYIDSVMNYLVPRAVVALDLPGAGYFTGVEEDRFETSVDLSISPNPAQDILNIKVGDIAQPILGVELYDIAGRLMNQNLDLNTTVYQLQGQNLEAGIYFVKIRFAEGVITKKVMFE